MVMDIQGKEAQLEKAAQFLAQLTQAKSGNALAVINVSLHLSEKGKQLLADERVQKMITDHVKEDDFLHALEALLKTDERATHFETLVPAIVANNISGLEGDQAKRIIALSKMDDKKLAAEAAQQLLQAPNPKPSADAGAGIPSHTPRTKVTII